MAGRTPVFIPSAFDTVRVPHVQVQERSGVSPPPVSRDAGRACTASTARTPSCRGRLRGWVPPHPRCAWLLLAILCLCLVAPAAGAGSDLSRDDASDLVLSRVLDGSTDGRWVYVRPEPVPARTTVETWYGDIVLPEHEGWLFFIDDRPMAGWAHPCRYVHVSRGGAVTVKEALGPPEELAAWTMLAGSLPASTATVRRAVTRAVRSTLPPHTDPDHSYAVLVSGGANAYNNWERYYSDIAFMYTTLVRDYGYADDHVYVLMSDGTDPALDQHRYDATYVSSNPDLDGDGDTDVQYAATKANIATVFSHLGTTLGPGDQLFIFTTDHGGPQHNPQQGTAVLLNLWGWDETITDDELATELGRIGSAVPILITMEQCYSGGFIDNLVPGLSGQERVIATASDAYHSSYADYFSKTWISAVASRDLGGNAVDADGNGDGTVSMQEAFAYSYLNRNPLDTPQYSDTPAGIGRSRALTNPYDPSLSAGFVATPTFGYTSLRVQFNDTSTGTPTAWEWAFGDGGTSNEQEPSHTYATIGTYTATLTVRNATNHVSGPVSRQITVADPATLGEAVDAPELDWSSTADDHWVVDHTMTHDGEDAARATVRYDGPANLSAVVTGPATVSFWWRVSDPVNTGVYLYIDDNQVVRSPRTAGWNRYELLVSPGQHTLSWLYRESYVAPPGGEGWLDQVTIGPPPALAAAFDADFRSGTAPLTVQFTDTSPGFPSSWEWAFGDGGTSTEQHPSHTYTAAGTYTVTLVVRNATGSAAGPVSRQITVADPSTIGEAVDAPALDWSMDHLLPWNVDLETTHDGEDAARSGAIGDLASSNLSTFISGPATLSFWWKVSSESGYDLLSVLVDGSLVDTISGEVDWTRRELALAAGPHTVTWRYSKDTNTVEGMDAGWVDRVGVLAAPTPAAGPSASFAAYPQSGTAPHTVQFLDYTPNAKDWSWDFGDGGTSNEENPAHVYNRSGLYSISLTVTDWAGQATTKTEYHFIRVTEPVTPAPTPVANVTANTTTGSAPLAVQFTDTSSPSPYHRWWQFGDGATSTDRDPVHVYERTGAYTVNLTVWTAIGQVTVSKPAYVIVDGDPRVPEANFTFSRTSGPAPLYVRFTDTSTGTPTSWRWEFGGLAWTTTKNPSVVFRQPGVYTVTLTVRNPYGWSSMGTNVTVTGGARSTGGRAVSVIG